LSSVTVFVSPSLSLPEIKKPKNVGTGTRLRAFSWFLGFLRALALKIHVFTADYNDEYTQAVS
ncbi:MAG: hypothetical protein WCA98_06425, partial [Candidatus Acidiferrales bacterium]